MVEQKQEPPRLHVVHHKPSPIRHTGVGEYQITMHLQVEILNAEKEMVHVQFLVDGAAQKKPQLLGDDGWCEETLLLKPNTQLSHGGVEPCRMVQIHWQNRLPTID